MVEGLQGGLGGIIIIIPDLSPSRRSLDGDCAAKPGPGRPWQRGAMTGDAARQRFEGLWSRTARGRRHCARQCHSLAIVSVPAEVERRGHQPGPVVVVGGGCWGC